MGNDRSKINIRVQHQIAGGNSCVKTYKSLINGTTYVSQKLFKLSSEEEGLAIRMLFDLRQQTQLFPSKKLIFDHIDNMHIETISSEEGEFLSVYTPYRNIINPLDYISTSQSRVIAPISLKDKSSRIQIILAKLLAIFMKSSNLQFFTVSSLFFSVNSDNQIEINLNKSSLEGMKQFYKELNAENKNKKKKKKKTQKENQNQYLWPTQEVQEVIQLLDCKMLEKFTPSQLNSTYQHKIKALAKILLCFIEEEIISSLDQNEKRKNNFTLEQLRVLRTKISSRYDELLRTEQFVQPIRKMEQISKAKYFQFFERVLVKEEQMKWSEVVNLLCPVQQEPLYSKSLGIEFETTLRQMIFESYGKEDIERIKKLGLWQASEFYLFLICMLHDDRLEEFELLFKYRNLYDFIEASKNNDFKEKIIYYGHLMQIVALAMSQCQIELHLKCNKFDSIPKRQQLSQGLLYQIEEQISTNFKKAQLFLVGKADERIEKIIHFMRFMQFRLAVYRSVNRGKQFRSQTKHSEVLNGFFRIFK